MKNKTNKKGFFSPVEGGILDGYTFKEFFFSGTRIVPLAGILLMLCAVIFNKSEFDHEPYWFWISISFLLLVLVLFLWKGIFQHWNDLKNHRSR